MPIITVTGPAAGSAFEIPPRQISRVEIHCAWEGCIRQL